VQFPQIGPINLAGLSFSQAQTNLSEVVEKQMIGVKSSVTMGALRTIRIFVLGEVVQPGSFTVGALSTMTNALFASGGINKVGSFRNIQLKRYVVRFIRSVVTRRYFRGCSPYAWRRIIRAASW
jgi:protein involved in polysaccharide export with SLBB domain